MFPQFIGGQMEIDAKIQTQKAYAAERETAEKQAAEENAKNNEEEKIDLHADDWIFHYTRAIILSHVSKLAQEKNFFARSQ